MAGDLAPRTTVQVRRSTRRRRTVAAYRDGDVVVVLIPARFSVAEEREWVQKMLARLDSRERRSRRHGDADLETRSRQLARLYFDDLVRPVSVRWVTNQRGRWGSCTPADGTVRISDRLRAMPPWVIDYVLVHELAHLRVPGHGPDFWALVNRFPRAQRARGYLEGVAAAAGIAFSADGELGGLTGDAATDEPAADDVTDGQASIGQASLGQAAIDGNAEAESDEIDDLNRAGRAG